MFDEMDFIGLLEPAPRRLCDSMRLRDARANGLERGDRVGKPGQMDGTNLQQIFEAFEKVYFDLFFISRVRRCALMSSTTERKARESVLKGHAITINY